MTQIVAQVNEGKLQHFLHPGSHRHDCQLTPAPRRPHLSGLKSWEIMIITSLDILSEEFLSGLTLDLFDAFLTTMAGSLNLFEGRLIGRSAEIKETLTRLYHSSNFLAESLFVKLNYRLTQQKQAHGCHKVHSSSSLEGGKCGETIKGNRTHDRLQF